jgi:hypothetical protein
MLRTQPGAGDSRHSKARSEPTTATAWLALVVMLGTFYLLSVGPIAAVSSRTGVGKKAVGVLYAPIAWLHERTPLKKPLRWYAALWGLKT